MMSDKGHCNLAPSGAISGAMVASEEVPWPQTLSDTAIRNAKPGVTRTPNAAVLKSGGRRGLRAVGDAVSDRTHPQRVHAVITASAVRQKDGLFLAFEPAFARQMPAHAMRDLVRQMRQLRGGRGAGAMQAPLGGQRSGECGKARR